MPAVLALLLVGCNSSLPSVERVITSAEGNVGVVVDGNNAFSWELYGQLLDAAGDDNMFFSPFSVTAALGMTMSGAAGITETEMKNVLHVSGDEAAWHKALGALTRDLNGDLGRGYTLNIANKLFGQDGATWDPAFLNVCETDYGAPVETWDFKSDPEGGRTAVNDWVEAQTNDRIVDLLPEPSVSIDTRLVLANAIYFLGDWATAFDVADTRDAAFTKLDGSTVTVPMMMMNLEEVQEETIEVGRTTDASIVRLPYRDNEVSMILVVPHEIDGLPAIEAGLDAATWATLLTDLAPSDVPIGMPRLEMDFKSNLVAALSALGMPTAFQEGIADFTGMTGDFPLYVDGVYHQAFVKVDEAGTEAAAATGVVMNTESAGPMPVIADRPYLFVIQDDLTGAILFVGRVTDPS